MFVIKNHPKSTLFFVNLFIFVLGFTVIELLLENIAPLSIAPIGHKFCDNAKRYGWGFFPYDAIKILDPDTGKTYVSRANNHGFRDKKRQYNNKSNAYRIIILGDSVTFGAIVPEDKTYTQILENNLKENGYNVEVINIAYGGWGTDQELEALLCEGIKYKPNLIIVQFCENDIRDNAYFPNILQRKNGLTDKRYEEYLSWKPFYYELNNNILHRKDSPYILNKSTTIMEGIVNHLNRLEIYKRLYAIYLSYKLPAQPFNVHNNQKNNLTIMYKATKTKLAQLKLAIDLKENTDLYSYLSVNMDKGLDFTTITKAIHSDGLNDKKQIIYRILENHWFHDYWSPENYYPQAVNIASYGWRLYNAIIDEMRKVAEKIKADIVIFPETEEGHYQWSLSWYRVTHNISFKANYLSHIPALKQLMKEKNIDVIENTQPYKRARNDPHPNIEGNNQIAGDIWKYLMRSRKNELELYKKITNY